MLVLASNYLSKCRCLHTVQCSAIIGRFAEIASFANLVQSAVLQLSANYLNQFDLSIGAG